MEIYPLTLPQINWPILLTRTKALLNRGITRHLDEQNHDIKKPNSFLSALQNLANSHATTYQVDKHNPILLHLNVGFLIIDPPKSSIFELARHVDLTVAEEEEIIIATANIMDWQQLFRISNDLLLTQELLNLFAQMGLKYLFTND